MKTIWYKETGQCFCSICNSPHLKKSEGTANKKSKLVKEIPYWSNKEEEVKYVSFDKRTYLTCLDCGFRHLEAEQHYG